MARAGNSDGEGVVDSVCVCDGDGDGDGNGLGVDLGMAAATLPAMASTQESE
jgi:hypothetical protein